MSMRKTLLEEDFDCWPRDRELLRVGYDCQMEVALIGVNEGVYGFLALLNDLDDVVVFNRDLPSKSDTELGYYVIDKVGGCVQLHFYETYDQRKEACLEEYTQTN